MTNRSTQEIAFEDSIVNYLSNHGWHHTKDNSGWDIERAMYVPDVLAWLEQQFPEEFEKAVPAKLEGTQREIAITRMLDRIVEQINKKPKLTQRTKQVSGGLLGLLRNGFSYMRRGGHNAKFKKMVQFYPENPLLTSVVQSAKQNKLRVLRQVRFDPSSNETLDLVLTVNGIPVVTMELKTDNTQAVKDSIKQYTNDRRPSAKRPLLQPGRCLVHFAVSNQEVYMTTELKAKGKPFFLPFNKGTEQGLKGNPSNPNGSDTSYLWEDILEPELFLRILRDYALWEPASKGNNGRLIFPRYHQLRATEKVLDDVAKNGVGSRYLIQHSAGSGKTKTIAWLAHRLGRVMDAQGQAVFDSIIVVTDRTALDDNIKEGLDLLRASEGLVVNIDRELGSKSKKLEKALQDGGHIINCTIQTFPALASLMETKPDLQGRNYCVIVDEAHSSQHGESAKKLRETLVNIDLDDNEEFTADDILLATDEAIVFSSNITFVALTATPKAKTIATYGVEDPNNPGHYTAFDTYQMSQAIDEGFILDVLANYSTYAMFARIRDELGRTEDVKFGEAVSDLVKFVRLHPTSIAQKVQVVVEHFRRNVMHELDGTAKAMVVAESRRAALNWSLAMNDYIATHKYEGMKTLVAFSGSQSLVEGADDPIVTESSLNGVPDTAQHFRANDDCKVLIVASKYQTGFDEPRLTAMYVDKKLSGVTAVQTLSRLNRTMNKKPKPMVVDFVNEPAKIVEAFAPYYRQAHIDDDIPFNALEDLAEDLDAAEFYTWDELQKLADAYIARASHEQLQGLVSPIRHRWNTHMKAAYLNDDTESIELGKTFRANLIKYTNAWEFLSQIVNYQDVDLHKRAIAAGLLARNLNVERPDDDDDYTTGIEIVGISVEPKDSDKDLELHNNDHDGGLELPGFDGRPVEENSPVLDAFNKAIEQVNKILQQAGINTSDESKRTAIRASYGKLIENEAIQQLAKNNDADQVAVAPTFRNTGITALFDAAHESRVVYDAISSDKDNLDSVLKALAGMVVSASRDAEFKKHWESGEKETN